MAPRLQLRTAEIVQLLGDPKFYQKNVAFVFMKEHALAAVAKYHEAILHPEDCNGCSKGKKDDRAIIAGPIATFVRTLLQLANDGHTAQLEALASYLDERAGYPASGIVLYYKGPNGKPKELTIR